MPTTSSLGTIRASRWGRWVVKLLCLLILPLGVTIASALPANAVTKYSNGETITFDTSGAQDNIPGWGIHCRFPVYTVWQSVEGPGDPVPEGYTHPELTSGHCELGMAVSNNHRVRLDFNGISSGGACTAAIDSSPEVVDIGGTVNGIGPHFTTSGGGNAADCDVSEVCIELWTEGGGSRGKTCQGVEMPSPAVTDAGPQSCPKATGVARPILETAAESWHANGGSSHFDMVRKLNGQVDSAQGWTGGEWRYYVIVDPPGTAAGDAEAGTSIPASATIKDGVLQVQSSQPPANLSGTFGARTFAWVGRSPGQTAGTGAVTHPPVGMGLYWYNYSQDATYGNLSSVQNTRQVSTAHGAYGSNDPSQCQFYWGEKIVNLPDSEVDDPIGGLDPGNQGGTDDPPPPDETPPESANDCGFSLGDPSSWLGGGICLLVGLIKQALSVLGDILGAIRGLVAALLSGLGTLLSSLFIPGDGFFEGLWGDAENSLSSTSFDEWKDLIGVTATPTPAQARMSGAAPMSAAGGSSLFGGLVDTGSGCDGPTIVWDRLNEITPGEGNLHPLSSCGDTTSGLAQLTKILLSIFIGLTGAYKCFGLLAEAIGAQRQVNIMGNFDWTPHTLADGENAGYVRKGY